MPDIQPPLRSVPRERMQEIIAAIGLARTYCVPELLEDAHALLSDALSRTDAPRVVLELSGVSGPAEKHAITERR